MALNFSNDVSTSALFGVVFVGLSDVVFLALSGVVVCGWCWGEFLGEEGDELLHECCCLFAQCCDLFCCFGGVCGGLFSGCLCC